jgi:hypothetical protein
MRQVICGLRRDQCGRGVGWVASVEPLRDVTVYSAQNGMGTISGVRHWQDAR